jgi:hypothetical protein
MRRGIAVVMVGALGPACGENANEIGAAHEVPAAAGAAGRNGDSAVGGSPDGNAGTLGNAGGPSDSGGAGTGTGGAGLAGATTGSGGSTGETGGAESGIGGSAGGTATACDDGTGWDLAWQQLECELIARINERRAAGYDCGIDDTPPESQLSPGLCPGREDYPDWVYAAGFTGTIEWEIAASGQSLDTEQLVDRLFDDTPRAPLPTLCEGMMDAEADEIAVGYYDHYWMVFLASGGD